MTQNSRTQALHDAGVSLWLDDLSRDRITSGNLQELIDTRTITGVTTNPAIFAAALSQGTSYDADIAELAQKGATVDEAVVRLTTDDVRAACDVMAPLYQQTAGVDGRVSIEVDPRLARETEATVEEAKRLAETVGRENVLIKIPATKEGLPAISEVIAAGISVNVTLIFSLNRYREVINAWMIGLERARDAGYDLSTIHSVASFFVSRVDTEIDRRLDELDLDADRRAALRSRAGLANARLAYRIFTDALDTERWRLLAAAGAPVQRPLWASTGTKDPQLPDTLYVVGLVAPNTVNTMPEKTLEALADHGEVVGDTVQDGYDDADELLDELGRLGIDYQDVVTVLETEGLQKFVDAWNELLGRLSQSLDAAR
ncbi:transaldolase [Citricoccus muralis]|uniref:Transaldolase n=1 Tax=Citricoccus muralis TaxID=169134 RepID=A0ABY8H2F6_9MICC|nr:transaldolase [Citricoccus muralis]WFP15304.1 transaldolase [Citricoccus muralis]